MATGQMSPVEYLIQQSEQITVSSALLRRLQAIQSDIPIIQQALLAEQMDMSKTELREYLQGRGPTPTPDKWQALAQRQRLKAHQAQALLHAVWPEKTPSPYFSITWTAKMLGVSRDWVTRRIEVQKSPSTGRGLISSTQLTYLYHRQQTDQQYITLSKLEEILGQNWFRIRSRLQAMGIQPIPYAPTSGRTIQVYPRSVLEQLETQPKSPPPQGDWLTMPMLVQQLGRDRDWIEKRIHELGIPGENRWVSRAHKEYLCHPPEALAKLQQLNQAVPPAKPGWKTADAIRNAAGRSHNWIRVRLHLFQDQSQILLDAKKVARQHYPPEVVAKLIQQSQSR